MEFFDQQGRCLPVENSRVFADKASEYYKIDRQEVNYVEIFERSKKFGSNVKGFDAITFESKAKNLLTKISNDESFKNLVKGPHIPFLYSESESGSRSDLGTDLENNQLQRLKESFCVMHPESHFKAVLQSDSKLASNVSIEPGVGYERFLAHAKEKTVVGWYFPLAFKEYDVKSQRDRAKQLPLSKEINFCLSGGKDICAALIGTPDLLTSEDHYAPILCMSSYVHSDPRLVLILKSYGPHMEFWCLTQMLAKNVTQVSEQWTGGITVFD